jgi:hypothetical protein
MEYPGSRREIQGKEGGPMRSYSAIAQLYAIIHTVGEALSDRQYGRTVRYVHEYIHKGAELAFDAPLSKVEWKTLALVSMSTPEAPSPEGPLRRYSAIAQLYATIYEMGKELSDRRYGRIVRYVHEYVHKGVTPNAEEEPLSKVEWKTLALVISRGKLEEEDSPEATLSEPELRRKAGGQPGNNNAGKKYLETNRKTIQKRMIMLIHF